MSEANVSAKNIQSEIYRKMSPAQKWEQVCQLRDAAWAMKRAGVRMQNPSWSEAEVENEVRKIFLYAVT
jgi:hypothetical protein